MELIYEKWCASPANFLKTSFSYSWGGRRPGSWLQKRRGYHNSVCHITCCVLNFISCVSRHQLSPPVDSPAVQPSPSLSSSQPAQQTRQIDSWWHTPRAWARGRLWCSTWRRCCVSPTRGESPRRGHGVYSRCCWLVQKLQGGQRVKVRK